MLEPSRDRERVINRKDGQPPLRRLRVANTRWVDTTVCGLEAHLNHKTMSRGIHVADWAVESKGAGHCSGGDVTAL